MECNENENMNLIEWHAVHKVTGEKIELDMLQIKEGGAFNKVYVRELAAMIDCTGKGVLTVLTYMLKAKTNKNQILGTQRQIAKDCGAGVATVARTFKALESNGYLLKKHAGLYLLNPKVMYYGGVGNKVAILRVWNGLDDE
jgi:hypothetical protein